MRYVSYILKVLNFVFLSSFIPASSLAQVGMLQGIISEIPSGNPINGARISVVDGPWDFTTGPDGHYLLEIPADSTWIIEVESPPYCLPIRDTVMVAVGEIRNQNYALEHAIPVTLKASFHNPMDASYRSFYLKGTWDSVGVYDPSWSGQYIEIRDDGIAPDPIARDGIFTGNAMLHPSSLHNFSWAVYSENYGGESARLQNGADFQFSNYTPPEVPTLAVNPSGSDNNWTVSVYGNGGALALDLVRGIDGNPTIWGCAVRLDSGIVYTLRFRVMHSPIASYGAGGIGGSNIIYVAGVTGSYDFIFNDRDDSYIIGLTGLSGEPVGLTAQGNLDSHIPLHWFPPGSIIGPEFANDDSILVGGYYLPNNIDLCASQFTPDLYPTSIDSVMIRIVSPGDPGWPLPDNQNDEMAISIFFDDGTGYPEFDPALYTEGIADNNGWITFHCNIEIQSGSFWVAVNNLEGGGFDAIGVDARTDHHGNKWVRIDGVWQNQDEVPGDFIIHAMQIDIEEDPPLSGWNIYRDTSPQPYSIDRRINGSLLIGQSTFDDWGNDPYGPLINGVTYYYQVSVVYYLDNGQFIEVGPSNQATATPVDHSCHYVPGDINSDSTFNGLDISFMVTYFKGGLRPSYICDCPPDSNWYVAGDVNGSCVFNGIDVTYSVAYFKGGPAPVPCPECPPEE